LLNSFDTMKQKLHILLLFLLFFTLDEHISAQEVETDWSQMPEAKLPSSETEEVLSQYGNLETDSHMNLRNWDPNDPNDGGDGQGSIDAPVSGEYGMVFSMLVYLFILIYRKKKYKSLD